MTAVPVRAHVRWMINRDHPEVLAIETASFDHRWTGADFRDCLRRRECVGMVAEIGGAVVGFMVYELHKTRLHVLNFAVAPEWRRVGVGTQMVHKLVGKLSGHRRTKITLTVRESNLGAQLFFRSQAFQATRVLRGYYEDSGEDAYRFVYPLTPAALTAADEEPAGQGEAA